MSGQLRTIVSYELERLSRDRVLWGAFLLVAALTVPNVLAITSLDRGDTVLAAIADLPSVLRPYLVVLAVVVGYDAVVGERSSGTIRFLLGNPVTRRAVVVGKLLSRILGVVGTLLALGVIYAVIYKLNAGTLPVVPFLITWAWAVTFTTVWVSLVVGLSAATTTRYRTLVAVLTVYAVFSPAIDLWGLVFEPLFALVFTGSTAVPLAERGASGPLWYEYVRRLNPMFVYDSTGRWLLSMVSSYRYSGSMVLYLFSAVPLALLGLTPLFIGLHRFENADLG